MRLRRAAFLFGLGALSCTAVRAVARPNAFAGGRGPGHLRPATPTGWRDSRFARAKPRVQVPTRALRPNAFEGRWRQSRLRCAMPRPPADDDDGRRTATLTTTTTISHRSRGDRKFTLASAAFLRALTSSPQRSHADPAANSHNSHRTDSDLEVPPHRTHIDLTSTSHRPHADLASTSHWIRIGFTLA